MSPSDPRAPTELELFVQIARHVIRTDGFDAFQPTVLFPDRGEVRILDDLPPGVEPEEAAFRWVEQHALPDEEFLVAFKAGTARFKVVRCVRGVREEAWVEAEG